MEQKSPREIQKELALPFAPEDLEWRLQNTLEDKMRGMAVPYVTNRAIQNRLDDVVGTENWRNEFKPWHSVGKKESQICGISIYFEGRGFVTKWDGAEDSDIEPVKGGLSDSMKRAAVQWSIGRILYSMDTVWVDIERRGKSFVIKDSERPKLDKAYLGMLQRLGLTPAPAGGLQSLLTPKKMTGAQTPTNAAQSGAASTGNTNNAPSGIARQSNQASGSNAPQPGQIAALPPQPAQQQQAPPPQPPVMLQPAPEPVPQAAYEYVVRKSKIQNGMNGSDTLLLLGALNGSNVQAYIRGAHPELAAGTALADVKLTLKQTDTVIFYVLEAYRIVGTLQAA